MAQKQVTQTQPDKKNGRKPEQVVQPQQTSEQTALVEAPGGLLGAAGNGNIESQAQRVGDARLQTAQRQALAGQIGRQQGNLHLQRVIQAARGSNGHGSQHNGNGSAGAETAEPGGELEGLGGGGGLSFSGAGLPGNGKNGAGQAYIQREDEAEGEAGPTEAEKAQALAAARAAEAQAQQAQSQAQQEKAKSENAGAAEAEAGKAAKAQAQEALAQAKPQPAAEGQSAAAAGANGAQAGGAPAGAAGTNGAQAAGGGGGGGGGAAQAVPAGGAPAGGGAAAEQGQAPASPDEDPAFQQVVTNVKGAATQEKTHAPASSKAAEAQSAAVPPANEVTSKAQSNQVGEMAQAETPAFNAAAFKAQLMAKISASAPSNVKEADEFKEGNKLGGVKGELQGSVAQEKAASQDPLKQKTEAAPDPGGIEPKQVTPLPPAEPGAAPGEVGAQGAAPKPKTSAQVEQPFQQNSQSLDQKMAEAEVTDEQLAKSNEPEFKGALDSKKEAQTQAAQAPGQYRAFEGEQVNQAQGEAVTAAQAQLDTMHGDRSSLLTQVAGQQTGAKSQDEAARAKVAADIQRIYDKTKTSVERILSKLDTDVDKAFDDGAEAAKKAFENYVDAKMEAYKEERYGGWLGWAKWAKDKLLGMPGEVNVFYSQGRELFIQKMDAVIDNVVAIIGRALSEAKAEVAKGKQEITDYVNKLPQDLRQVGEQAAADIQSKFEELESSIDSKQNELIDRLASKYNEKLQAVDARIEELKAANQGLVDKALNAVVGVIRTIMQLKDMLLNVLAKVASVVTTIIKDPVGFLGNLITGIKMGLENFIGNIGKHLINGLVGWLTGALGPMGIKLPEDIFSLQGIFSLVMQILGLTWENIRARAVALLGEPVVKALETGFEIFKILITEGPIGLWNYVKDMFSNLKEMVMDAIVDLITTQVIQAGIKWIMGLLTPAGAFIKAAMAIIDIVKFFFEKATQLAELVNSIVDSIAAIASGSLGGAARMVEDALARTIPIVIGFLANLLGIGDLAQKVQGVIEKVRGVVNKGIDWVINKAKAFAGKVMGKLGIGKSKKDKEDEEKPGVKEGLKALYAAESAKADDGTISKEDATAIAGNVKAQHPVFKSITVIEGEQSWDYDYVVQPTKATGQKPKQGAANSDWNKELTFDLTWPKPPSKDYPTLYFGGELSEIRSQSALRGIYKKGQKVGGHPVKEYKPHTGGTLPGGDSIGLSSNYQISTGKTIGPLSEDTTPGGGTLNNILKKYGFSPDAEYLDADHVVEIQMGGKDVIGNMWPLDASINRSAGSRLSKAVVKHPETGEEKTIAELKQFPTHNKYKFKIAGFS